MGCHERSRASAAKRKWIFLVCSPLALKSAQCRGRMMFRLQHQRYRLPFRAPVRTAHGLWSEREGFLVRAESESGGIGFGEVAPVAGFGSESVALDFAVLAAL